MGRHPGRMRRQGGKILGCSWIAWRAVGGETSWEDVKTRREDPEMFLDSMESYVHACMGRHPGDKKEGPGMSSKTGKISRWNPGYLSGSPGSPKTRRIRLDCLRSLRLEG